MTSIDWISRSRSESILAPGPVSFPWPRLIENILLARGIISETERSQMMYPKLSELKDPMSILGMDVAVERISEAFLRQEKICIYADFDLDGTSGLALLWNGLKSLGFENVIGYQPRRLKSGYGFHAEVVDELSAQGVKLIITVDVGITAMKAAERARQLGVDVIITDHHQPSANLPDALVVINPNQKACTSGLGYLSGAGVALYLLRALRRGLEPLLTAEAKAWDMKSVLDFFTIATITDMVPLIGDNRVLIKHGLHQLAKTEHVGLRALLSELDLLGRPLTSQDVGIRFAPKLNALSRMDSEILPIDLMMAKDEIEAENLIERVMKSNENRIALQQEADSEAQRLLQSWSAKNYIFLASEKFHRGVIGLVAQKLSQSYQVPVFIGSIDPINQKVVGSSRAPENTTSLVHTLSQLTEHLDRFGGHIAAAGFEFRLEKLELVDQKFISVFADKETSSKQAVLTYEVAAELQEIDSHFMKWYEFLGPFGVSFEIPLIKISKAEVESVRVLKGKHLKIKLRQNSAVLEALMFSALPKHIESIKPGSIVDLIIEPQWNYFAGKKTIQALVKDLKLSSEDL